MSKQHHQELTLDKIDDKIKDLKNKFSYIKEIKELITNILISLDSKMLKVDIIYEELSNINKVDYLYIFGLDSLNFQKLYIRIEMDNMIKNYVLLINRFYCNYYKLFNIIKIYIFKNIKDKKILDNLTNLKTYPKYNDINIYQKYDFETITDIFHDIINLINILNDYGDNEKQSMNNLKNKQSIGLKINTFIYTYQSNYEEILNKILLFTKYCLFFTNNNIDYLLKYQKKLQLFFDQINEEIKLENVLNPNFDLPISPTPISNSISPNEKLPEDIKLLYQEKTFNNKLENSNKIIENQNENIKISIYKDKNIQNDENISNNQTITNSLKKLKNIASIIKNNNKKKFPELIPIISQNINENLQNNIKKDDNINKIDNNLSEINNNIDHENNNEIKDNENNINNKKEIKDNQNNINNKNNNEDNQNMNNNINEDNQNIDNNNINEDNQNIDKNNENINENMNNNINEDNQNIDNNNINEDNQNINEDNQNMNNNINEDNQNIDNNNENINEDNQNIDNNNQNINEED